MHKPLFKQDNQGEILLFPSRLDENIPDGHLVRIVNEVVNSMDISILLSGFKGGGTTAYHPRMLLKVLLYAYCLKIYTGRKIAAALRTDITFMWLSGKNTPNFNTINSFRSGRLKEGIEKVFKELLLFMFDQGYIRLEDYFCDGTTLQADANKHKMVWKKNAERYKNEVESRIAETLGLIDQLNEAEERQYGDRDLAGMGAGKSLPKERINQAAEKLEQALKSDDKDKVKKAKKLQVTLETYLARVRIYQEQSDLCGNRSGYSKTDPSASPMRTKECSDDLRPAYNGMIGTENQFITGVSVHDTPNDGACFKAHLEKARSLHPRKIIRVIADAGFGTEENYDYLEKEKIKNLMKYPSYDKENSKAFKENIFLKEHLPYDATTDTYLCPNGKRLLYQKDVEDYNKNGYRSVSRLYESENCTDCPFFDKCGNKRDKNSNRTIKINTNLERHKSQTREALKSEQGAKLIRARAQDTETCFGDIKHNGLFRRVHLRGLEKVNTEFTVIAMAHNIRKIDLYPTKRVV